MSLKALGPVEVKVHDIKRMMNAVFLSFAGGHGNDEAHQSLLPLSPEHPRAKEILHSQRTFVSTHLPTASNYRKTCFFRHTLLYLKSFLL